MRREERVSPCPGYSKFKMPSYQHKNSQLRIDGGQLLQDRTITLAHRDEPRMQKHKKFRETPVLQTTT